MSTRSYKRTLPLSYYVYANPSRNVYLKEIFQNMHLRFLNASDPQCNHPASVDDTETTTPRTSTSQDHSKSILSRLGKTEMSIFGGGFSGGYIPTKHAHFATK